MEKTDSSPLSRQALYADKKQWNQFLSVFCKVRNSRGVINSFCPARYIHPLE